ncbi:hypothetical protein [Microbacterium sp. NPDC076911]|uniref:hypothetical protein n=1 Tax=Microbacterium sp. NPDC076911 TaxID=3154958 RepID=UPI0034256543
MIKRKRVPALVAFPLALTVALGGCATGASDVENDEVSPAVAELSERLGETTVAISAWHDAEDLAELKQAAEQVRNLVTGEVGPYYGDADGDGTVSGAMTVGVLPGLEGEPGLASIIEGDCLEQDVLGGDWSDPAERWQILDDAIVAWAPTNNTFPSLPSHPQRTIGWATLALNEDDLETAREFASHAQLHINVTAAALQNCK